MYGVVKKRVLSWEDPVDSRLNSSEEIDALTMLGSDEALKAWILAHHGQKFTVYKMIELDVQPTLQITEVGSEGASQRGGPNDL